jgi:uncharacterized protein (TIGR01244 family)
MSAFKPVTSDFSVAPQIKADDVARAAALGFRTIINNRPEGEAADQAPGADIAAAAAAHGLSYVALPYGSGPPPPGVVSATAALLNEAPGPILAYCRTGTRSILAWAMAQALEGALTPDEIIAKAVEAGYDIGGARGALQGLAPKP